MTCSCCRSPARRPVEMKAASERALAEAAAGRLHPLIGQRFPLDRAADAHAAMEAREAIGKTLLEVPPGPADDRNSDGIRRGGPGTLPPWAKVSAMHLPSRPFIAIAAVIVFLLASCANGIVSQVESPAAGLTATNGPPPRRPAPADAPERRDDTLVQRRRTSSRATVTCAMQETIVQDFGVVARHGIERDHPAARRPRRAHGRPPRRLDVRRHAGRRLDQRPVRHGDHPDRRRRHDHHRCAHLPRRPTTSVASSKGSRGAGPGSRSTRSPRGGSRSTPCATPSSRPAPPTTFRCEQGAVGFEGPVRVEARAVAERRDVHRPRHLASKKRSPFGSPGPRASSRRPPARARSTRSTSSTR